MAKSIIDKYFTILGYVIEVRAEPLEYREDLRHISHLIDNRCFTEAFMATKSAYKRWGYDRELIRLDLRLASVRLAL